MINTIKGMLRFFSTSYAATGHGIADTSMGTLNRDEIIRRISRGELILGARSRDGSFDVEPASYDLTAGIVVWKNPPESQSKGEVKTLSYDPGKPVEEQPTLCLQPGQMVFVITHEEIKMPPSLTGTVYSRNNLARDGILALNAGHIDPGFQGPIVIRLINLRAVPWVLALGTPIFTIVFHTLGCGEKDTLVHHRRISREETLTRVWKSAEDALSNALFELYSTDMRERLLEHYAGVEQRLREAFTRDFVTRAELDRHIRDVITPVCVIKDDFQKLMYETLARNILGWIVLIASIATIVGTILSVAQALRVQTSSSPVSSSPLAPNITITVPSPVAGEASAVSTAISRDENAGKPSKPELEPAAERPPVKGR